MSNSDSEPSSEILNPAKRLKLSPRPPRREPHTCSQCETIIIRPPPTPGKHGFRQRLQHSRAEALQAARDGCPLFKLLLKGYLAGSSAKGARDFARDLCSPAQWKHTRAGADSWQEKVVYFAECLSHRPFMIRFDKNRDVLFTCMGWSSMWFKVTALPSDEAYSIFPVRPINRAVGSELAFEQANSWLQECLVQYQDTDRSNHRECTTVNTNPKGPTRLLQIGIQEGNYSIRLCEVGSQNLKYACLSYCWGGDQPVKTTLATLQARSDAIQYSELPQTLKDAILVTQKLGLQYLWIDCLCIIQDSESDMSSELGKMPSIYRNAHVTISASNASTCYEGFLGERSLLPDIECEDLMLRYQCPNGEIGQIILSEHYPYDSKEDPINSRAWTLQERVLSPRLLDYGVRQLRWVCHSRKYFDGGFPEDRLDQNPTLKPVFKTGSEKQKKRIEVEKSKVHDWANIVDDYTKRSLSYPSDKLVALSALASDVGQSLNLTYLAGLWLEDLPSQLLWRLWDSPLKRPEKYRAPSWSWASVDSWVMLQRDTINASIDVVDHKIELMNRSLPYGSVKSGSLTIRGRRAKGRWFYNRESKIILEGLENTEDELSKIGAESVSDESLESGGDEILDPNALPTELDLQTYDAVELIRDSLENGWDTKNPNAEIDVFCLRVKSQGDGQGASDGNAGLLLIPLGENNENQYYRVGYFYFEFREQDCFRNIPAQIIELL